MNLFYTASSTGSSSTLTHINPSQILGQASVKQGLSSNVASARSSPADSSPNSPRQRTSAARPVIHSRRSSNVPSRLHSNGHSLTEQGSTSGGPSSSTLATSLERKPLIAETPASTPPATSNGDGAPTTCSNCSTTNTPLWRRDQNGQPLCNVRSSFAPFASFSPR
jgi:GATA-binding protein